MLKNKGRSPDKRRNPEKVVMDRYYHPKVFRRNKRDALARLEEKKIKDYFDNFDNGGEYD